MNREPSAASLVAEGFSRIADTVGVVLLCLLGWHMFFVLDSTLQPLALAVGLIGVAARLTQRAGLENTPLSMFLYAYVAIALVSSVVHQWAAVTPAVGLNWTALVEPAFHLVVMAVFVSGAAHLLRTERRLSVFVVLFVAAVLVSAAQISFDWATHNVDFVRAGTRSLPSIPQWGGVHGNSLVLALGFPLALAIAQRPRPVARVASGLVLGVALIGAAYVNGSRGGLISMIATAGLMGVLVLNLRLRNRRLMLTASAVVMVAILGVSWGIWSGRLSVGGFSGRGTIFRLVADLISDHVWLGVGPGNYAQGMREGGYAALLGSSEGTVNAHNLLLRVAAETGIAGMLCLLVFQLGMVRACHEVWFAGRLPVVSLGLCLALVGFLLHSLSEDYLDARAEVERTRLLVWMCFGAGLAVVRLPRRGWRDS